MDEVLIYFDFFKKNMKKSIQENLNIDLVVN